MAWSAYHEGHLYKALIELDTAIDLIRSLKRSSDPTDGRIDKLIGLRKNIASSLSWRGNISLEGNLPKTTIFCEDTVEIFRPGGHSEGTGIPINYSRISRRGRQTRIVFKDGHFFLVDLKSTNGTFIEDTLLDHGAEVRVPPGASVELAIGGNKEPVTKGHCRFRLRSGSALDASLTLRLIEAPIPQVESADLKQKWPTLDVDQERVWIHLRGSIPIKKLSATEMFVGHCDEGILLGFIRLDAAGYKLIPAKREEALFVNGIPVTSEVPLQIGATIENGAARFSLRKTSG